jgi:dihydroorotate dehydrogenase (fumarate)
MDLTTRYLGLTLKHPFMPGASPLTGDLDFVSRLEDAGAAAIVMHSLFEEEIIRYGVEADVYLEQLLRIKQRVDVPVIASLNGTTSERWLHYAHMIERAGASALELNFYHVATDPNEDAASVEGRLLDIVAVLKESIEIPLAVKLSPFYSALPHLVARLDRIGVDGLVLFNRFYQPDINPKTLETAMRLNLSTPSEPAELLLRLRWIAIVSNQVNTSIALSGGVHCATDAVKGVMAGAHAVQLVSVLLHQGPSALAGILREFERWGESNGYHDIDQMRGRTSLAADGEVDAARKQYRQILRSWHAPASALTGH